MTVEWQTKTLGELLEKTETTNPLQAPESVFEYIDVSSVSNQSFFIESTQRIKGKDAPSRARRLVKAGDILFATIRPTLQRIAIVPDELDHQVCSTGYFVMRPIPGINNRFVFYSLFTEHFMGQMAILQKGASYPAVTDGEVRAQPLTYPRLLEQQRIVAILDEAFEGIAAARAGAEQNLQNARALFESHLHAVFSRRGEGWISTKLGDVYDVRDGTHDSPKFYDTGHPLVTSKNLKRDGLNLETVKLISVADYKKINERSAVNIGDVLFAMIGTIGNPVMVEAEPNFAIKNMALFKVPKTQSSQYLRYFLSSECNLSRMKREANGTTQKFVGLGYLRNFEIVLPTLDSQRSIVAELDDISEECRRLETLYQRKLAALDDLKKSLLHQAFSGQF